MARSRENKVGPSQLFDVTQPLELRGVYDSNEEWVQLHMAVDGIIEHLAEVKTTNRHENTRRY